MNSTLKMLTNLSPAELLSKALPYISDLFQLHWIRASCKRFGPYEDSCKEKLVEVYAIFSYTIQKVHSTLHHQRPCDPDMTAKHQMMTIPPKKPTRL